MIIQSIGLLEKNENYRWTRSIDGEGEVFVSIGDSIGEEKVIAKVQKSIIGERINLAKLLEIPINDVSKYIKCWPGEIVHPGDIVAEKSEKRGMTILEVKVTRPGMIDFSELHKGFLIVRGASKQHEMKSRLAGKVYTIIPHRSITIETKVVTIQLFTVLGQEQDGEVYYLDKEEIDSVKLSKTRGKIIITNATISQDNIWTFTRLGARGVVVNAVDIHELQSVHTDLESLSEAVGYSVAILSGFGGASMPHLFEKIFKKIRTNSLAKITTRDNLLVLSDDHLFSKSFFEKVSRKFVKIRKGIKVKVASAEWYGYWGKVVDYKENGVVIVQLDNKKEIEIMYKNLYAF